MSTRPAPERKMSFQDVEHVQTDKTKSRKVILIAALVAIAVILMAAFGAVYYSSKSRKLDIEVSRPQNAHRGSEEGTNVPSSTSRGKGASFEASEIALEDTTVTHSINTNFLAGETEAILPVHDEEQVFVIFDQSCEKDENFYKKCELVLHKIRTLNENNIIAQDTYRSAQITHDAKVSPNGRFIGFIRTYGDDDPGFYFFLADRNGNKVGQFRLPGMDWKSEYHFSFTPDSNGIIYTANEGKEIKRVDFTPESTPAPEILLELTSALELKENVLVYVPVLLANGALVYSVGFGDKNKRKYKVCMKKKDREEPFCWETHFGWGSMPLLKFIPFENVVYCVEHDETIWKIDTNAVYSADVKPKFPSFTVDYKHFLNGTISYDGKFLYLIASIDEIYDSSLIKINIESAFTRKNVQITSHDIVIPLINGDIVALVPTLRDE